MKSIAMMNIVKTALHGYGLDANNYNIEKFGNGLINNTWLVENDSDKYILQKVNNNIFKNPFLIANNIEAIESYFKTNNSDYFFVAPIKNNNGKSMVCIDENHYFRMFKYVANSHTLDVVETPKQAFEAAKQFGKFTKVLSDINIKNLQITLPDFHDLSLRYKQFLEALENGNVDRIKASQSLINILKNNVDIVDEYDRIKKDPGFKLRVTHHDTKISNVLFDDKNNGICVIDLDTVMPGYFISDVGDMMRTYLCPVSEEEQDFDKIEIRDEFYQAIVQGYNYYMQDELSDVENNHFLYAGKFMIYMQALRFITDYLNNDVYYGSKYPNHNYVRAKNQTTLLQKLIEKEAIIVV